MSSENHRFVLTVSCPERNGIVLAVSDFLNRRGATIVEAAQHRDTLIDQFFMRVEFEDSDSAMPGKAELAAEFSSVAEQFQMQWQLYDLAIPTRMLVAVSQHGHCLNDILHRWESDGLPVDIIGVYSNHDKFRGMVEWYGLPFYHLPVSADNKSQQEARVLDLVEELNVDLIALARYMQILSADFCERMPQRIINIHHSFLPGFKGADPYRQAYNRGVKIIGATAHYVTADLDEGPIIEQSVEKIDHNCDIEELRQIGRDAECSAFARALKWHGEHRIIVNGSKTIVFR